MKCILFLKFVCDSAEKKKSAILVNPNLIITFIDWR